MDVVGLLLLIAVGFALGALLSTFGFQAIHKHGHYGHTRCAECSRRGGPRRAKGERS